MLKILCVAVIAIGALRVFAVYNEPADQSENAFKPLNVSPQNQIMNSSFYSHSFMKAGNTLSIPAISTQTNLTWNKQAVLVAEKAFVAPRAFIDRFTFLPGNKSQIKVGSTGINSNLPPSQPFTNDDITPLIIDMNGRGSGVNDRAGREAIQLSAKIKGTSFLTNTPAIQFSSTKNPKGSETIGKADIIAGSLILDNNVVPAGSIPVLVATDTKGNAVWGYMNVVTENGVKKIKVNYDTSVVQTGQNMCGAL